MSQIKTYKDLIVWQRSMDLVVKTCELMRTFPDSEKFSLINQIQRAAVSVPANIAEGYGRSPKSYSHYLVISRSSLNELETELLLANRINYLDDAILNEFEEEITQIGKMLTKLIYKVKSCDQGLNPNS
ncbi:MAG: four helix bundle protein [Bacteroidales bacterium]|nr:four helix bundle protein [Bacteroidales bacterium]